MTINGKFYREAELDFNTVCEMENMGVSIQNIDDNIMSAARAYAAICMRKPLRLAGAEIYVTLEPCPMCAGAIMNARIDKIYFGSYEKKSGACGSAFDVTGTTALNSRAEVVGGVREDECRAILTSFFKSKREN